MKKIKIGSLQIEPEAKHFSSAFYIFQRVGFLSIGVLLLIAFLGFLGNGIFSSTTQTEGNLSVSYEKFIRQQASTVYRITIQQRANNTHLAGFWIEPSFYNKLSIKSITPTPVVEEIVENKVFYTFNTAQAKEINITLVVEPEEFGAISSKIGLSDGETIQLNQIIYP